jgi:hypothetical protein
VYESALGVHQVKLLVELGPGLADGCCVGQGADSALDLGEVTARNNSRRLVEEIIKKNIKKSYILQRI